MEDTTPAGKPIIDREKTSPFLIRAFIKVGAFHRLTQFEDGPLPIADEQQVYTWKDTTLREVLTTLRATAPATPEYKHPLARYTFRAVYADSANRGRVAQKDLGTVYSRDILGEPGSLTSPAPRLLQDEDTFAGDDERTLDELRFVPGDYLCVMVQLPKNAGPAGNPAGELTIKGGATAVGGAFSNGWKKEGGKGDVGRGDGGWSGSLGSGAGRGGGGHWRGDSNAPGPGTRGGRGSGRGGAGGDWGDRRVPPPRRESPVRQSGRRDRERGRGGDRRSRSPSRSRSPVRRRNSRYD